MLSYAYFPINCIVSINYMMADGASTEIAVVGNDGIIGVTLFMGGLTMKNQAIVRNAGYAYRLEGIDSCRNSSAMGEGATGRT